LEVHAGLAALGRINERPQATLPEAVEQVAAARRTVDAIEGHLRRLTR
jgi:hypothetical protein